MNEMIARVARAGREAEEKHAFGLYDYSSGDEPPHVVRNETTGDTVFRSHDRDSAANEWRRLCDEFVARAVIEAMREPTIQMLFGTKSEFPDVSLGAVWKEMIDAALK